VSVVPQLLLAALWLGAPLDVPFVQQTAAACGPASAAMVMQYWARERPALNRLAADADRVARTPVPAKGITGAGLKRLLERSGFRVFLFDAERRDLDDHLTKGRPLIVCFAPNGKSGPLHFAVVAGIDRDSIVLNDPTRGKLFRESLDRFLPQWSLTGNWTLLAVPRDDR
jgi:ABC-type bacteriocin/lantibiotic exporter with double-glycine peptidase domain